MSSRDDDITRVGRPRLHPERIGPCRLVRLLGVGGMGSVYLGEMLEDRRYARTGEQVALKVLHPDLATDTHSVLRFQREAELGTALDHPSIVRTHDAELSEVDGVTHAFLILEYVEGRTLAQLLDLFGRLPEALLRDVGAQVAAGLAAVHEAGAVHRDLKPANVLLTPDHQVKIMDLGVAHVASESARMTTAGDFVGTLHYAAPEQFESGAVGASADLYSMGVLLYEASTGNQPFADQEFAVVMRRHLEMQPRKAGELNPQVSPFFEEMLATLLEKIPERRFADAATLAAVLQAGESSRWWQDKETSIRSRSPRGHLRRMRVPTATRLVGRERELERLLEIFRQARAGRTHVVVVEGEAGVGKTRLVDEAIAGVDDEVSGTLVLHGACEPGASGSARGPLARAVVEHFGESRLEAGLRQALPGVPRLVPGFASWLTGASPAEGTEPLSPEALHVVFSQLVRTLAREQPVLWVVEDVHHGSRETFELVRSMARAAAELPLLLVATTRPGLPSEDLAHLQAMDGVTRLELPRLEREHVVTIVAEASGSQTVARELGRRIVSKSDGNPYFVFEMIRDLKERGLLRPDDTGRLVPLPGIDDVEPPSSVRELLRARLSGLGDVERRLLDVGAVQGFAFDPDLVARVLRRERLEVLQSLAAIERHTGVVRATGAGFRFDHHLLQEVIYEEIPPVLRAEYHALHADALLDREDLRAVAVTDVPGVSALSLAEHYLRAGQADNAEPFVLRALDHLASTYHPDALLELSNLAIDQLGERRPALRCDLRLRQVECLDLLGRRGAQRAAVEDAISAAEEAGDTRRLGQARAWLGWLLLWLSRYGPAERTLESALEDARAVQDRATEARAISNLGLVAFHRGRHEAARDHHERDLTLSRGRGSRRGEGRASINLGIVALRAGDFDLAGEQLEVAIAAFREIGYRQGELLSLAHLGGLQRALGRHDVARTRLVEAIALAREIGFRQGQANALVMLARVAVEEGRLVEAAQHADAGLELATALNNRALEAEALIAAGRVRDARGEAGVGEALRRALEIARELDARELIVRVSGELGRHLAERSIAEGLQAAAAEAAQLLEEAEGGARELGLHEHAVLAAAHLALLGARPPENVEPSDQLGVPARAEAHEVLLRAHSAGGGEKAATEHGEKARELLDSMCSHLAEEEIEAFWRGYPTARRARE